MDKEKQIEELDLEIREIIKSTSVLMPRYSKFGGYDGEKVIFTREIAESLYSANCRKINDNEIVISKEEKQKLLKEIYEQGKFDAIADLEKDGKVVIGKDNYNRLKRNSELYEARHEENLKLFAKAYNQGCKETAEKFYDLVKEKIEQIEKFYFDNGKIGYNGLTVKELNKLAKEFGVEIKE